VSMTGKIEQVGMITSVQRSRRWSAEEKAAISFRRPIRRAFARRDCRIRHNPATPDPGDHIVSAYNPLSVWHEIDNKFKNLRLDVDPVLAPTQFATIYVKRLFSEFVPHWPLLG
jgi:hypothetical protein